MKNKYLLLIIFLPLVAGAQTFTKINQLTPGITHGVNRTSKTIQTTDGHIWFNSIPPFASFYALYEYDGTNYTYYPDVSASYFAQANDGLIFTSGGQVFNNNKWSNTTFKQTIFCQSQDKNFSYFLNFNSDTIFSYSNGAFVETYAITLEDIEGLRGTYGNINYKEAAADNNGNIYFTTDANILVRVNLATKVSTILTVGEFSGIRTVHVASNGHIYVGGHGFFAYYAQDKWNVIYDLAKPIQYLDRVNAIAEDAQGRIWITSRSWVLGNGFVARFDEADHTKLYDMLTDTTKTHDYIYDKIPQALLIDTDDTFYFGVYQEAYLLKVTDVIAASINEITTSENLAVYPNPSSDFIKIEGFNSGTVSIYNLQGQLVVKQKLNNDVVDVSNLQSGQYIIKYQNHNAGLYHAKFIRK